MKFWACLKPKIIHKYQLGVSTLMIKDKNNHEKMYKLIWKDFNLWQVEMKLSILIT